MRYQLVRLDEHFALKIEFRTPSKMFLLQRSFDYSQKSEAFCTEKGFLFFSKTLCNAKSVKEAF